MAKVSQIAARRVVTRCEGVGARSEPVEPGAASTRGGVMADIAAPEAQTRRSVPRWRRIVSMILIILGAFLVPISTIAVFARNQVLNTDRFVATMKPLARNSAIQEAAATRITNAVMDNVPIEETLA